MKKQLLTYIFIFLIAANLPATGGAYSADSSAGEARIGGMILKAEDILRSRYGGYAQYNINFYSSDFRELKGVASCCPLFHTGSGSGFSFGGLYETPVAKLFLIGVRVGYSSLSGEFAEIEEETMIRNGQIITGEFEHKLIASISDFGIEPYVRHRLIDNFFVSAGLRLGITAARGYEQSETIVSPSTGATFMNDDYTDSHSRIRNENAGDIPSTSKVHMGFIGGISMEFPMNSDHTMFISPEIEYHLGFSEISEGTDWTIDNVKLGLAFKYSPMKATDILENREFYDYIDTVRRTSPTISGVIIKPGRTVIEYDTNQYINLRTVKEHLYRTDTVYTRKQFRLVADVEVAGSDSVGNKYEDPIFRMEEFHYSSFHPILTYIFFDEMSSDIPDRYVLLNRDEAEEFESLKFYKYESMQLYYQFLNIVGRRMKKTPEANLTIVGCNSDRGDEKNNKALSEARAKAVFSYLRNTWDISDERLIIEVRDLPRKASTPIKEEVKIAENRRVELYCDYKGILDPVFISDTIRQVSPIAAEFDLFVDSEAGLKNWELKISRDDKLVRRFSGNSKLPEKILWNIRDEQSATALSNYPYEFTLFVEDIYGNKYSSEIGELETNIISLEKKTSQGIKDKSFERYSLILFEFDNSRLKSANQDIVDFINSRIKKTSKVEVLGYTDQTGKARYNAKLSLRRARSTARKIVHGKVTAKGIGESLLLYDNELPEGRFYCRTVRVIVETPVGK